mgnify:CR=1 FL=1
MLTAPGLTQELILKNLIPFRQNPYVSLLGYKAEENLYTYDGVRQGTGGGYAGSCCATSRIM